MEVCKSDGGETNWVHMTDVEYILPVDNVIRNNIQVSQLW